MAPASGSTGTGQTQVDLLDRERNQRVGPTNQALVEGGINRDANARPNIIERESAAASVVVASFSSGIETAIAVAGEPSFQCTVPSTRHWAEASAPINSSHPHHSARHQKRDC